MTTIMSTMVIQGRSVQAVETGPMEAAAATVPPPFPSPLYPAHAVLPMRCR